jgi:hemolysin III
MMTAIYFMFKVMNSWVYAIGFFLLIIICDRLSWELINEQNGNLRANVNYSIIGLGVLIPTFLLLIKSKFKHWLYVALALFSFMIALFFRISDQWGLLQMGTHFLWHTFGALAGNFMLLYIYRYNLSEYNLLNRPNIT